LGRSELEMTPLFDSLCPRLDELEQSARRLLKSGLKRRAMVGTTWRWATGARKARCGAIRTRGVPEELFFLLTRRAKGAAPTGERDDKACTTLLALTLFRDPPHFFCCLCQHESVGPGGTDREA
jgi:hypothetical protein